tara:strand:+ start:141 stop:452 length:312 start_codon:yes stop_codon:yes gene_type:complete
MATLEIPLSNQDPAFSFDTILDKNQYEFDFRFNSRVNIWMVDILDAREDSIINSLPVYSNRILTNFISNPNLPEGTLFFFTEGRLDADRFTFGKEVKFYYEEA